MIKIQTFRLEPYFAANTQKGQLTTEWLREAVNKLMRDNKEAIEKEGADVSLFYNHDPKTRSNRIGYPLIIYHYINGLFYITGINEGEVALTFLAKYFKSAFIVDGVAFPGFRMEKGKSVFDLTMAGERKPYALVEWRPIHHDDWEDFAQKDLIAKVKELNIKLEKHISNELGKYLGITFDRLDCTITDITRVYEPLKYKNKYEYTAFDIRFTANVSLPGFITLGNHKALGFGRVIPL
jgi:hypothetical protein